MEIEPIVAFFVVLLGATVLELAMVFLTFAFVGPILLALPIVSVILKWILRIQEIAREILEDSRGSKKT